MNCRKVQESLSAYYDKEISEEERLKMEEHLSGCEECHQELQQLHTVISDLKGLESVSPDPSFRQELHTRLFELNKEASPKASLTFIYNAFGILKDKFSSLSSSKPRLIGALSSVVVMLFITIMLFGNFKGDFSPPQHNIENISTFSTMRAVEVDNKVFEENNEESPPGVGGYVKENLWIVFLVILGTFFFFGVKRKIKSKKLPLKSRK